MPSTTTLTPKGAMTRARIVEAAADHVLAHGVGGTSLDDIGNATATSKSQLFHYFPGGKRDLVAAIASYQSERVLDAQRPFLDALDTWEAWEGWRQAVVAHYGSQAHWGCPIGTLGSELAGNDPTLSVELAAHMAHWRGYLVAGLTRMRIAGLLRADAVPATLGLSIFAALQGGLLLTRTMQSIEPLDAALQGAMTALRAAAAPPVKPSGFRP